jgi:hypothetical protein
MVRTFIRHRVRDYADWRSVYDSVGEMQEQGGVRAKAVFQAPDDPNDVIVTHDFDDVTTAEAFFAAPELRDAMMRAGVEGEPTVWFGVAA